MDNNNALNSPSTFAAWYDQINDAASKNIEHLMDAFNHGVTPEEINDTPEFLVTTCPDHGVKVAGDLASAQHYRSLARGCHTLRESVFHQTDHRIHGEDCWSCCEKMEVTR